MILKTILLTFFPLSLHPFKKNPQNHHSSFRPGTNKFALHSIAAFKPAPVTSTVKSDKLHALFSGERLLLKHTVGRRLFSSSPRTLWCHHQLAFMNRREHVLSSANCSKANEKRARGQIVWEQMFIGCAIFSRALNRGHSTQGRGGGWGRHTFNQSAAG